MPSTTRRAMRSRRDALNERRRPAIGRKSTNSPNQNNGSAHCAASRPPLYARASRKTPTALVRLSAGNHPQPSATSVGMGMVSLFTSSYSVGSLRCFKLSVIIILARIFAQCVAQLCWPGTQ